MVGEIAALVLLAAVLAAAIARPRGLPEAAVAVPAAAILIGTGVVSWDAVGDELRRLLPVLAFLAAILVLGQLSAREGLFEAAGRWLSRASAGSPARLLRHAVVLAVVTTSLLSLDATAVLLTPVVLAAAGRLGVSSRAPAHATGHLANSGSLLLPMANLTNLLAVAATGIGIAAFAAAMALPLLAAVAVEYAALRWFFRRELAEPGHRDVEAGPVGWPRAPVVVIGCALVGFAAASLVGVDAAWVALAAALALAAHTVGRGWASVGDVARAMDVPFLLFVAGLAIVVRAAVDAGLGDRIAAALPTTDSLAALLVFAIAGAVLANVVNNIPAFLILLTPALAVGTPAVLAVLIGVNIGPNLAYPGSLATLLWRRVLDAHGAPPSLRVFTALGALTVPAALLLATMGLWVATQVLPIA